jgi:hypothetical protein
MDKNNLTVIKEKISELKALLAEVGDLDNAITALDNIEANYLTE